MSKVYLRYILISSQQSLIYELQKKKINLLLVLFENSYFIWLFLRSYSFPYPKKYLLDLLKKTED